MDDEASPDPDGGDLNHIVHPQTAALVGDINHRAARFPFWTITLGLCWFLALLAGGGAGVAFFFVGMLAAFLVYVFVDSARRETNVQYVLDDWAQRRHERIHAAASALGASAVLQQVVGTRPEHDWKRNAGASEVLDTHAVAAVKDAGFLHCNVPVVRLQGDGVALHFLPDHLYVLRGKRYTAYPYGALRCTRRPAPRVVAGRPPADGSFLHTTWKYVNRDGSRDRRFNGNQQMAVYEYLQVELSHPDGFQVKLEASDQAAMQRFIAVLRAIAKEPAAPAPPPQRSSAPQPALEWAPAPSTSRLHICANCWTENATHEGWGFVCANCGHDEAVPDPTT